MNETLLSFRSPWDKEVEGHWPGTQMEQFKSSPHLFLALLLESSRSLIFAISKEGVKASQKCQLLM